MPPASKLSPTTTPQFTLLTGGDILDGGVVATEFAKSKVTAVVYGRNRVGKTTLACQGEGPTALLSIEPSPTGGARSVSNRSDIMVYRVSSDYLPKLVASPGGIVEYEPVRGSEKMLAIAQSLKRRFASGQKPFRKVVIDGISSWNDIILSEILGVSYAEMPTILSIGKVSGDQYSERAERLVRFLKPFFDLPCDLWVIAQERDHNPPKTESVTRAGKSMSRPTQTAFMRDAHPLAQEGSFFSLAVSDSAAKWVQDSCDFVMQLYEDNEWREERTPDINMNGQLILGQVTQVPTGRQVKRLRCKYHPNYAAGPRACDYRAVPEYIQAPSPEEMYAGFLDMVAGKRTKWGHYSEK